MVGIGFEDPTYITIRSTSLYKNDDIFHYRRRFVSESRIMLSNGKEKRTFFCLFLSMTWKIFSVIDGRNRSSQFEILVA